jgi:hypothetical protein
VDEHEGKKLISESAAGRLYVYWEEYKSNRFLHTRYWYNDKKDGMWKPSPKGIAIPESKVNDYLAGLREVLTPDVG